MNLFHLSALLMAAAFGRLPAVRAKTCLMLYQMADNNLEYYLRQDYQELANSPVVANGEELRTWVYYDARNSGGAALPNTLDENGNPLSGNFFGSRYVTYDASWGRMRVNVTLEGEQNSDASVMIQNFLQHSLTDCLSNGYDSLMAVFASHGGGVGGYGGDEHHGRRRLLQTNAVLASAIRAALANTPGAPAKLYVIGFDACLMLAMGAADDYSSVADYMLGSEAVEPGSGWAYSYLTSAPNALVLAEQIVTTFTGEKQGMFHQSPKILSVLDTAKFTTFVTAFEELFAALWTQIRDQQDKSLHTFVGRARSSAIAYESIMDAVGTQHPSGLDIGSFLTQLQTLCLPADDSNDVGRALTNTMAAYNDMWHSHAVGPGTSHGTGMHINWPNQGEYHGNRASWDSILFTNDNYVTQMVPNYRVFLQYYLSGNTINENPDVQSVCGTAIQVQEVPEGQKGLIYNAFTVDTDSSYSVTVDISPDATQMTTVYGMDLKTMLKQKLEKEGLPEGMEPSEDDFLYLFNGDVTGTYEGNYFKATWEKRYYYLQAANGAQRDVVFVADGGQGSRSIPVLYFPEDQRDKVDLLSKEDFLFLDFDFWIGEGALPGFLTFSVMDYDTDDGQVQQGRVSEEDQSKVHDNLILFTTNDQETFTQVPYEEEGLMLPIIRVLGQVGGRNLTRVAGGFDQTVIDWREDMDYHIVSNASSNILEYIPGVDAVFMAVIADDGTASPDTKPPRENFRVFEIYVRDGAVAGDRDMNGELTGLATEDEKEGELESSSPSRVGYACSTAILVTGFALSCLWSQ